MVRTRLLLFFAGVSLVLVSAFVLLILFGTIEHTHADKARYQLRRLDSSLQEFRTLEGRFPEKLEALVAYELESGAQLIGRSHIIDPWGRPFFYRRSEDGDAFLLFTLGADGRIGGEGQSADLEIAGRHETPQ